MHGPGRRSPIAAALTIAALSAALAGCSDPEPAGSQTTVDATGDGATTSPPPTTGDVTGRTGTDETTDPTTPEPTTGTSTGALEEPTTGTTIGSGANDTSTGETSTGETSTGSSGTTSSDTGGTSDTTGTSTETGHSETDTDTTGGPAACGDGLLGQGEACDDGNVAAADACSPTCEATVLEIAAGSRHNCALLAGGAVKCWGKNYAPGVLGNEDTIPRGGLPGEMGAALPAAKLGGVAVGLSAGHDFSCALLADGRIKCWGLNVGGSLGLENSDDVGSKPGDMGDGLPAVNLGVGILAAQVSSGPYHSCARLTDDRLKCWGNNAAGATGFGVKKTIGGEPGQMGDSLPFVDLGPGLKATQVVTGSEFTCALLTGGAVKCWGRNDLGQLGLGDELNRGDDPGEMGEALPFVDLGAGVEATELVVGSSHACALLGDHRVKCWGSGLAGTLGLGSPDDRGDMPGEMGDALPPVDLGTGRTALALAASDATTCALLDDRTVKCWGYGWEGALGLGDSLARGNKPGQMGDALPVVDLGTGLLAAGFSHGSVGDHVCALLVNGERKCWGNNVWGQLGLGDKVYRGNKPGQMGDALPTVKLIDDQW